MQRASPKWVRVACLIQRQSLVTTGKKAVFCNLTLGNRSEKELKRDFAHKSKTGSTLNKKKKVELFAEQVEALTSVFEEGNNRPVQPLNDCLLAEDSTP